MTRRRIETVKRSSKGSSRAPHRHFDVRTGSATGQTRDTAKRSIPCRIFRRWLGRYRNTEGWTPSPLSTVLMLFLVRVSGALTNGIADCDETFNYWEPLHLVLYGSGLQTWEYSPEFAIRSYAFLYPYAMVAKIGVLLADMLSFAGNRFPKLAGFYSVRLVQASLCAFAEFHLYDSVVFRFGKSISRVFLVFSLFSPGMYRAASELLPSSFCMILFMHAASNWYIGRFRVSIMFVGTAALLGWPFSALLGAPIALHVWYRKGLTFLLSNAILCSIAVLLYMVPIDSLHFGRFVIAPLNIFVYNVFPNPGAGPDAFGVSPWTFYARNLILNCNIPFLLVLTSPTLCAIDALWGPIWVNKGRAGQTRMNRVIFLSPCLIWLAVFLAQPHKEERFLSPIYPFISLIGAVVLDDWLALCRTRLASLRSLRGKHSALVKSILHAASLVLLCATALVGISRIVMQVHSSRVPLTVFERFTKYESSQFHSSTLATRGTNRSGVDINICIGNEWFRFPGHFFLPSREYRLRFIRSAFRGLLPRYFNESQYGTRVVPEGMNMFNKEDPRQYFIDADALCHYFVGFDLSHRNSTLQSLKSHPHMEPSTADASTQHSLFSLPMIDLESSPTGRRAFFLPFQDNSNVYGQFYIAKVRPDTTK